MLRGIAILLVVLGHANRGAIEEGLASILDLRFLDFAIYSFHMPIFFYLGGYFTARTLEGQPVGEFVRSRGPRILWPYLLWSGIYFLAGLAMSLVTTVNKPVTLQDLLAIAWQPLSTLWFLYALLAMQLVASLTGQRGSLLPVSLVGSFLWSFYGDPQSPSILGRILFH